MKVVKFGGSSLASGDQVKKVFDIVTSDPDRKVVVVSAPGKRYPEDRKVTDLLIELGERTLRGEEAPEFLSAVISRYSQVAEGLKLPAEIVSKIEKDLIQLLNADKTRQARYIDAIKASGEDNNAKLIAEYFRSRGIEATYINPKEAGLLVEENGGTALVLKKSYENLKSLRKRSGILIFPGFFGYNEASEVVTFSRSGSDITGSILANGIEADLYENFTDVDAVYSVNPNVVTNPKEIRELTYREMRELSYAGFSVFHDEALIPAFEAGIPVHIKNTNNPEAAGTRIVNERKNTNGPVIGIASDDDFCSIYVNKYLMNKEIGFGRKLLSILEDFGLTYEHSPSGIDDLSIILRQKQMNAETEELILERIRTDLKPDEVTVEHNLSLIMMVGEGMRHNIGTAARASKALAEARVNIEMINQGSSEVSMMFGVKEAQEKKAVQALYEEFFVGVYA
ncbi:aspartate kinase [Metabacillus idriensis]|uniref:aspartate kinase n=1 Tax=Metabacillus idriensis TaxID=324768 RepID=UPI002812E127|nr:aspartate kinase [Metabacillus idriensis]MDR0137617.1 aspartate kinase [Metabacillus idriensis]